MNKAILVGRMTRDPELRTTANGTSVCTFSVAVNRRFRNAEGNYDADFINCVAFGRAGEFAERYFRKGITYGYDYYKNLQPIKSTQEDIQ